MTATTTRALVLKMHPFRETSAILHCFTRQFGLVHAMAKGIKRPKHACVERGAFVELLLYYRDHKDLHTAAQVETHEHFLSTRSSLVKTALRDAVFEIVLKSVGVNEEQPAVYTLLYRYCRYLDAQPETALFPCALWKCLYHLYHALGFGMQVSECMVCSRAVGPREAVYLQTSTGGFCCSRCAGKRNRLYMPAAVRAYCVANERNGNRTPAMPAVENPRAVTDTFISYWQYHCDIPATGPAVDFLYSLLNTG